jgi:hypothetical protein
MSGALPDPDALRERHGLRLGGTSLPGVVAAGTFYDGRWWFLDVHHPEEAVKIDLDHEHYATLIVEVENPVATVAAINAAVATLASKATITPQQRRRAGQGSVAGSPTEDGRPTSLGNSTGSHSPWRKRLGRHPS